MLAALVLVVALMATGAVIIQLAARLGAFGTETKDVVLRNPHVASNIVLTVILWVIWCYLAGV